ncbi:hypothetical protein [Botrimarina hoheduenensis]|uniref:Uncharacterized protein n=1 Tax=Botrimarina hoheduenensis TaxID=2528000 RepID=A0A5C5WE27_9BACT|nr:hypothetical protein [Botrimarina hoheduenensis]TWT48403.1 hypothetical protein Pla111_01700 [Botrimarina hoheduenensis]
MTTHYFKLILDRAPNDEEQEHLYALFEDGSITRLAGVAEISFCREAPTLPAAIRSAVNEVRCAGFIATQLRVLRHSAVGREP